MTKRAAKRARQLLNSHQWGNWETYPSNNIGPRYSKCQTCGCIRWEGSQTVYNRSASGMPIVDVTCSELIVKNVLES